MPFNNYLILYLSQCSLTYGRLTSSFDKVNGLHYSIVSHNKHPLLIVWWYSDQNYVFQESHIFMDLILALLLNEKSLSAWVLLSLSPD